MIFIFSLVFFKEVFFKIWYSKKEFIYRVVGLLEKRNRDWRLGLFRYLEFLGYIKDENLKFLVLNSIMSCEKKINFRGDLGLEMLKF